MSEETEKAPVGSVPEPPAQADPQDLIQKANFAADRLEAANKELARLLSIQQKMVVEKTLSGQTVTGIKQESSEEKAIKNAKGMLDGTGFEDIFNNPPNA